jgi:signal transduction histidine kinase
VVGSALHALPGLGARAGDNIVGREHGVRAADLFWLSALAHDLRSPLTSLATTSELLEADLEALDHKDIRAAVGTIRRGTVWLLELAENLLAAAAINDDRLHVQPTTIALLPVIGEVEGVVQPVLAQREQRLRTLIRGEAQPVLADRRRLAQILINLVLNASKYSPARTTIDVVVWHRGHAARIAVADRGPGIPRAYRERIFEPFFRVVDGDDGGKTQGDGLGLAIVRSLVEAHGSATRVECRRGGGTRIWFELNTESASS